MDLQGLKRSNQHRLTLYFSNEETASQLDQAYDAYVAKYKGLATTKNRFLTALLIEGITHYAKDNSIAWMVA